MVYCSKCGVKNEDEAEVCVKCGAPLYAQKRVRKHKEDNCFGPREERRFEEECFGLPYGGAIFGIIFGIVILIFGVVWVLQTILDISIDAWTYLGPLFVIAIGILVVLGVVYRLSHRR